MCNGHGKPIDSKKKISGVTLVAGSKSLWPEWQLTCLFYFYQFAVVESLTPLIVDKKVRHSKNDNSKKVRFVFIKAKRKEGIVSRKLWGLFSGMSKRTQSTGPTFEFPCSLALSG